MVMMWVLLFVFVFVVFVDLFDLMVLDGVCFDVEVVFVCGIGELFGVGGIGEDFIDVLCFKIGEKFMGVYGVDYLVIMDFLIVMVGIYDVGIYVE